MKKIDIIGGNGYLGQGLAKFLTKRNIFFRNISREENSIRNSISFENWLIHKSNNTCIYLADPSYVNAFDDDKYHKAIESLISLLLILKNICLLIKFKNI